jgi:cysteine synthase A
MGMMVAKSMDILESIGNTPLVELKRIVQPASARILVKLEWANPTGSMKDRMARAAIQAAEKAGKLQPGSTVVEYTGGTTGISLAFICAVRGYKIKMVSSDVFGPEKIQNMRAFGAEVELIPSQGRGITAGLIRQMIARAKQLSHQPGHWWSDQFNNRDAIPGYYSLGEEIWRQSGGQVTAFVQAVGTAHSLLGTAHALLEHRPDIQIVAVEPSESAVLSGGPSGSHGIGGIGVGFIPPLWEPDLVNEIMTVSTGEAKSMARRLARQEGFFAGTSSGANIVAALRVAERLGSKATVVTLMVDSGLRYMSVNP